MKKEKVVSLVFLELAWDVDISYCKYFSDCSLFIFCLKLAVGYLAKKEVIMKRYLILSLFSLNVGFNAFSGNTYLTIDAQFEPYTFEDMYVPLQIAENRYRIASNDFDYYFTMGRKELNRDRFQLSMFYFEKAQNINCRYDGAFFSIKELNEIIKGLQEVIAEEEKSNKKDEF